MDTEELLTTEQAAEALRISPMRVRQLAQSGQLPARRLGRDWVIRRADLDAARTRNTQVGRPRKGQPTPDATA